MYSEQNIVLVGPMGVGKTTIGKALAAHLNREFLDTDRVVEERTGADIPWIFDVEGEIGFRRREEAVCKELMADSGRVIATGGGIVLNEANRAEIRRDSIVIFLSATVDQLVERTAKDTRRPLLQNSNPRAVIEKVLEERLPLYQGLADIEISTESSSPKHLIQRIIKAIGDIYEPFNS